MNPPARQIPLQVRDLADGRVVSTHTMHLKRGNGHIDVWFTPNLPGYRGDIAVIEDYAVNEIHDGRYLDSNRYAPWNGWFVTENLPNLVVRQVAGKPQLVATSGISGEVIAGPGATSGLVFALDAAETFKMTSAIRAFREWFIQGHAKRAEENKKVAKLGPVQALVTITPSSMQRTHYGLLRMDYYWFPQSGSSTILRRDIEEDAPGAESGNTVAREHLTTMEHELQRLGGPLNALGEQLVAAWNKAVSVGGDAGTSAARFPLEIWARWYGSSDALQRDGGSRNDMQSVKMRVDIEPTKKSGPRRGVPLVTLTPIGMQEPRGIYRDLWTGVAYKKKPRVYGPYTGAELAAGNTGNYPGRFALKKNDEVGRLAWDRSLWLLEPEGVQQVLVALDARQEQGFSGRR
jgi:hypothetical protein